MSNYYPVIAVPSIPLREGWVRFWTTDKIKDVNIGKNQTLFKMLQLCDGYHSIDEIASMIDCDVNTITSLISNLEIAGIVVERNKRFKIFHEISNYPTSFTTNLTQKEVRDFTVNYEKTYKKGKRIYGNHQSDDGVMDEIITMRHSCRDFSDMKIDFGCILNILKQAYSLKNHSVPSAGGLYPMRIYLMICSDQNGLKKGYYEYDSIDNCLIHFDNNVDVETIKFIFNSDELPFNSSVQIIIAGEMNRHPYKYGNRGYRFTMFEAGAIAENISLCCTAYGLGTCELGGMLDLAFRKEFQLEETDIYPLIGIAVGYEKKNSNNQYYIKYDIESIIEKNKIEFDFGSFTFNDGTLFFGWAKSDNGMCGATGTSSQEAEFKAIMESYERSISSHKFYKFEGSAHELARLEMDWINPMYYVPLTEKQITENGFDKFDEDLELQWINGYYYENHIKNEVYVPTDLVFYGFKHNSNDKCIYHANSSGVAAYNDVCGAEERAVMELCERDAIMKMWYNKKAQLLIEMKSLPTHIRKRYEYWSSNNRKLEVYYVNSKYSHVFLAVIRSDEWPCFVCGAAAAMDFEIETAMNKAVAEAEYSLFMGIKNGVTDKIKAMEVKSPSDHGRYYHFKKNAENLEWIWNNSNTIGLEEIKSKHYKYNKELVEKLRIVFVDISDPKSDIKVIRALAQALVPISFGVSRAHYTHTLLNINDKQIEFPHFFD